MRENLALDPLQRVVDRLGVAAELLGHVLVGRALEVEAQSVRLDQGFDRDEVAGILEDAYVEVAPPKLVEAARGDG